MGKTATKKASVAWGKTFKASLRNARISPYKARAVIDMIRGKPADVALQVMEYEPRRAASMILKVLRSAVANASNDLDVNLKSLVVIDARVDGAGLLNGRRRWQPRAMGRAFPILKRTSHISIVVGEPVSASSASSSKE
jgi:large subunit ribosomal protein L22